MPKLLFRHLPRHYPANSAYALFPFFTPETTRNNLKNLKIADQYDFARPKPLPIPKVVDTLKGISQIFNDNVTFKTNYPDLVRLTGGRGCFLTFDSEDQAKWVWFPSTLVFLLTCHLRRTGTTGTRPGRGTRF